MNTLKQVIENKKLTNGFSENFIISRMTEFISDYTT